MLCIFKIYSVSFIYLRLIDFFRPKKHFNNSLSNQFADFNDCPFGVLVVNTEGTILWHNAAFSHSINANERTDSTGTTLFSKIQKGEQHEFKSRWEQLLHDKKGSFTTELILLNHNHEEVYFDAAVSVSYQGQIVIILKNCSPDKTKEIKAYRHELDKTHASLLDAHKLARLGHWEYNINKNELILSAELKKILQIEDDTFFPHDFLHVVLGKKADELIHKLQKGVMQFVEYKNQYHHFSYPVFLDTYVKAYCHANETTIIGVTQDITEQENTQKRIENLLDTVKQRNKELRCLLRVTQLCASDLLTAEQIINETVRLIPDALNFSEQTACEITIAKVAYRSDYFFESKHKLEHNIRLDEKNIGTIKVYRQLQPQETVPLFSTEENNLIKALSFQLSGLIRTRREEKIRNSFMEQVMESEARYERLANSTQEGVLIHKNKIIVEYNLSAVRLFGYAPQEFAGLPVSTLLDNLSKEKALAAIDSDYDNPIEYTGIKKDGTPFPIEVTGKNLKFKGEDARVSIIRDLTLEKENQREINHLLDEVTERNKQLQCLLDLSSLSDNRDKSIDEVLKDTVKLIPPTWQHSDICCGRIIYGNRSYTTAFFQTSPWYMTAPIPDDGKDAGYIEVYYTEKRQEEDEGPFLKEERYLINALGIQLSLMIEKKRHDEKIIASVLETADKERTRFAKELHDSLGQTLTAVAYNLNTFKKSVSKPENLRIEKLDQAIEYLHHGINETRTIAHHLMPKTLDDFGYIHATRALINAFEDKELVINLIHNLSSDDVRLDKKIELALYRITQESMNNTIKHAKASEVTIQLMVYPDLIIWTFEDNGIGFCKKSYTLHNSFGLNGLYTRANAIGGTLMIDSSPGRGVLISLEIPLNG